MTLSDLTSKTPEELNVMCAELCGYERQGAERIWWNREQGHYFGAADLPNYTGSWDAIMPEVGKLKFSDKLRYRTHLQAVVSAKFPELGGRILTIDACTTEAEAIDMTRALILTLHPNQPAPTK